MDLLGGDGAGFEGAVDALVALLVGAGFGGHEVTLRNKGGG